MRDVLCIYYSRTGNTKRVMETIAKEMDAELLALTDGVERSGLRGWLRSGMDAMRKDCPDVLPFETERKLENYRLVIVGTPVWAGRCSSVIRSFLKNHGGELNRVAYVLTRGSEHKMRGYLPADGSVYGKAPSGGHIPAGGPCGPHLLAGGISPADPGTAGGGGIATLLFKFQHLRKEHSYAG
ncbi:MAG: flavodoxin family protein [Dysosmobacter sp.]